MERFAPPYLMQYELLTECIGQNSSFVYNVLLRTLESWTGSFLSAVLSLPDPGLTDIADSTHPLYSLGVAVAASAITAIILSPLDIVRTRYVPFSSVREVY